MLSITTLTPTNAGLAYQSVFIGTPGPARQSKMTVSALTANEVTADGKLKPGVPIIKTRGANATLVTGAAQVIKGVTLELQKIAKSNSAADLTAAGTAQIVYATSGEVSRQQIEDQLGRVLTANELAAFDAPGCLFTLVEA